MKVLSRPPDFSGRSTSLKTPAVAAPAMRALAVVAAAVLLAGCLDNVPFLSKDEVPARNVADDAEDAAKAWKADAVLTGAFAFESRKAPFGLDEGLPLDPDVGNGKAVAWAFTYVAGSRQATFVVNASGDVWPEHDDDAAGSGQVAVSDWVDSDDAMDAARGDDRVVQALGSANAVGVALGDNGTSGPVWTFFTLGADGIVAVVDARSGDLLYVEPFSMPDFGDWGMGAWGMGGSGNGSRGMDEEKLFEDSRSGQLAPVNGAQETFDAPPGATRVVLEVSGTSVALPPGIDVRLLDPSGAEVDAEENDDRSYEYDVDIPGPYTVDLKASQGSTAVAYDLAIEVWGYA